MQPHHNPYLNENQTYYGKNPSQPPPPPPPVVINPYENKQMYDPPAQNIITINNMRNAGIIANECIYCHSRAGFYYRRTIGTTALIWGFVLLVFTGCCCFIPCLMDDCMDKNVICNNCHQVNRKIQATF